MFGLGEKINQAILVCMLVLLFSVENNVIENTLNVENVARRKSRESCAEDCATLLGKSCPP